MGTNTPQDREQGRKDQQQRRDQQQIDQQQQRQRDAGREQPDKGKKQTGANDPQQPNTMDEDAQSQKRKPGSEQT